MPAALVPTRRGRRALAVAVVAALAVAVLLGAPGAASVDAQTPTGAATASTDHPTGTGEGVTVAVVDTGIDDGHPDLEGRVVDRIDLTGEEPTHPERGTDAHGHGTHVAGIVAGSGAERGGRHAGVAPNASLVDVRIMTESGDRSADAARVAEGIEYAVAAADADIVLLSLNSVGPDRETIEARVEWARARGVLVVASAGNDGGARSITTPGTAADALTVGATDSAGRPMARSSRGPTLEGAFKPELLAPGERIAAPRAGYAGGDGDPYARRTGTSVAAAAVAGAAARVLAADPGLSPADLEDRLTSTARPIDDSGGYAAGSGELDLDRALDPGVVATGVVDAGVLADDGTVTRTVAFENRGERARELPLAVALENADTGERADGVASLNRSRLRVEPGERAAVELRIDGNTSSGAYAGEIRYAVDGEPRSVAVGFVRGGSVTVEKRPLTPGDRVEGDELLVFTEAGTHSELLEFENGTASFLAGGGTYVLWSAGVDDATGSLVLLSERIAVAGDTRVTLDESETVRAGVDVARLRERYGPLENRSVSASMVTAKGDGTERLSRSVTDATNRTVRVSRDRKTSLTTTYLLTTASDGENLDASDVFHVSNHVSSTRWATVRDVRPRDLRTTTYRFGRTTVDRTPEVQERASVRGTESSRQLSWFGLGDRRTQRVHRTAGIDHARHLRLDGWRAAIEPQHTDGGRSLSHPLFARADVSIGDGTASIEANPLADGAGTKLYAGGRHTVSVAVDGVERDRRQSGDPAIDIGGVSLADGESLSVRIDGDNPEGRLSTRTRTDVTIRGTDLASGASVPLVRDVRLDDATPTNAAGPGPVTARIDTDSRDAIADATVWHASGDPGHPPWEAAAGWERAPTGVGYRGLRSSLDAPAAAETVSLAVELETDAGSTVRTMTANAFHVGRAPNTSTRFVGGRLLTADGGGADNDTVVAAPVDGGDPVAVDTDRTGRFEFELPKNERYDLGYRRGDLWDGEGQTNRTRPDFHALGRVETTDDTELERTLPRPTRLGVTVRDERGVPVGNATVRISHRAGNATSEVALPTSSNGTVALGASDGVGVGGTVDLVVEAPDERPFAGGTERRTVAVTGTNATETVVLGTEPPRANLSASRTWMLNGTFTTLDAGESDVPAGPAEYRWDLDGDGTTDRVTDEAVIRYTPEAGVSDPSVTVVDAAGKRATASVGPIRVTERE